LRSGDRVRITAQLIRPQTGEQLWTNRYERDLRDVLRLQDELTSAIANQVRLKLAPEEARRLSTARLVNPEAHDAYLQGRFHWQKLTRKELDIAEQYFRLALEKDSRYALAYTGLGIVWGLRCNRGFVPCSEAAPKWKEAVRTALELDPTLAEARAQAAAIRFYADWDWVAAGQELAQAVKLDPNYAEAHVWYGEWLY